MRSARLRMALRVPAALRRRVPLELTTLIALGAVAAGLVLFAGIADEVVEGDSGAVDRALLLALRSPGDPADPVGPPWLEEAMRDLTALGSTAVLALATATTVVLLLVHGGRGPALLVAVAVGGGQLLSAALKLGFGRPRPDLVPHATLVSSASFPSGHSMLSAITWLTLAALGARLVRDGRVRVFLVLLAALLSGLVGVSRVYLGVHWPTDVVAGWALGAAWASACWTVARALQRRGDLERPPGG